MTGRYCHDNSKGSGANSSTLSALLTNHFEPESIEFKCEGCKNIPGSTKRVESYRSIDRSLLPQVTALLTPT